MIELVPKHEKEKQFELNRERGREEEAKGRWFSTEFDLLCWPQTEVRKTLKARSRAIKLHALEMHHELLEKSPFKILYERNQP
jgi:hypothetical protein